MKILLTAFEPFGEDEKNASLEALNAVTGQEGICLVKAVVPVVFKKAADTVIRLIEQEKPDAVICLGQAGGRKGISLETRAVNICSASIPDNEGNCPKDEPVVPKGKEILASTLPVELMLERLTYAGISASLSDSAGTYVCNSLMYGVLHYLENAKSRIPAGFIHVPYFREQTKDRPAGTPFMELGDIVKGAEICVSALGEHI